MKECGSGGDEHAARRNRMNGFECWGNITAACHRSIVYEACNSVELRIELSTLCHRYQSQVSGDRRSHDQSCSVPEIHTAPWMSEPHARRNARRAGTSVKDDKKGQSNTRKSLMRGAIIVGSGGGLSIVHDVGGGITTERHSDWPESDLRTMHACVSPPKKKGRTTKNAPEINPAPLVAIICGTIGEFAA